MNDLIKSDDPAFDLSEDAIRQLYPDREPDFALDRDGREEADGDGRAGAAADSRGKAAKQDPKTIDFNLALPLLDRPPSRVAPPEPAGKKLGASARRRRKGRLLGVIAGLAVILVGGYWLLPGPRAADHAAPTTAVGGPSRARSVAGVLGVADLAAGRALDPGATYGIDRAVGKTTIKVASGRISLLDKKGAVSRPCSDQSFAASDDTSGLLVSACDAKPAFIVAVIPPPPLPEGLGGAATTSPDHH